MLAVCLGVALVFVLLSRWQLESSRDAQTVYDPGKEIVRPLDETMDPGSVPTLEQVDTAARTGRNPQTGAEIKIPAGKRVKVTAGSKLKAAVK